MKNLNMTTAIKRYNDLMFDLCREHNTIGTALSENTERWNLRDMVSEVQYTLDLWNDDTSLAWEDAHDSSQPVYQKGKSVCHVWYDNWISEKNRMSRFINAYSPFVKDMECHIGHCSKWD